MPTHILGISALFHDSAAALLRDGEILGAAQEERFTRIKHDAALPVRAGEWCLAEAGITAAQLDYLVFYEKPLEKFQRIVANSITSFPRGWRSFPRVMQTWLGDKLWTRNELARVFGVTPDKILFSRHHLSHAASAFFTSPHEEAAILTVDGVGENATTALWRGTREPPFITPIAEVVFPQSLGLFYSAMTAFLGFAVNEGEYKVMGMAAFGEPRYREQMGKLLKLTDDGGFIVNMDYFCWHWHPTESYTPALVDLLGEPRFPGTPFDPRDPACKRFADIAASVQVALEDAMLHLVRHAHEAVGGDALCLAGGVALNAVANNRIAEEGPFSDLWVQPAAGDAGGALGAALWAWHCVLGHPKGPGHPRIDLGRAHPPEHVGELLDDLGAKPEVLDGTEALVQRAVAELVAGGVIGWFQGRSEWGPRALGHRSILADPRGAETRDRVNARVKFREAFRPFAPAVTEEAVADWFVVHPSAREPARRMLVTPRVLEQHHDTLQAITHVDGTARVQVVRREEHPLFHKLLTAFGEATGVPILLNTSFNLKGDPIVDTPVDALAALYRSDLDAVYIENFRVPKPTDKRSRGA